MTIQEIVENKATIMAQKCMENKYADAVVYVPMLDTKAVQKAETKSEDPTNITVKVVINTTNILDSHGDVHLDGLWNKSVKEQKNLYLLEEHKMSFRSIISDKVTATLSDMEWKQVGVKGTGTTQALIFEAEIDKERNPYMFEQYSKGYVKNHSVGMRYVKMELAVNNKEFKEEFAVWEKNIDKVVNRAEAEAKGYFWAVKEAKIIEGSAVPMGSNSATPTLSVEEKSIEQPSNDTDNNKVEPSNDTHKGLSIYNFN